MASEVETTPSAHHANRLTAESKSAYLPVADRDSSDSEGAYGHRMVVKMTWMVFLFMAMVAREWSYSCFSYLYSIDSSDGDFESIIAATGLDSDAYSALTGFGITATCASFMAISGICVFYRVSRLHVIMSGLFFGASGSLLLSFATSVTWLSYGIVLISVGAGTMYTPTYSLARGLFIDEGYSATASGVIFGGKAVGNGFASLSIVIAESIGWRNTYRIIAGVLITSMVGVVGMSMSDPDLADNLAKPIPQIPASGASKETGAAEETPPTSTTVSTSTGPDKKPNMGGLDALAAGMYSQLTPFLAGMWVVSVLSDTPLSIVMWWYPSFISSTYPDSDNLYSMYNAALQCVMGASGGIIGGRITDVMGRENAAGMLHTPAILQLSGAAGLGGSIFSGAFLASFGWYGLFVFCTTGAQGAMYTIIQNVTRSKECDAVLGTFLLVNWLVAAILADWIGESSMKIGSKLIAMVPLMVASGVGYFTLAPSYEGQRRRAQAEDAALAAAEAEDAESADPLLGRKAI